MLLAQLLKPMIHLGTLTVVDAHGKAHKFEGSQTGSAVTIKLHDPALHYRLALNPKLYVGEAVMDGTLTVEEGDVYDFFALLAENLGWQDPDHWLARLQHVLLLMTKRLAQYNPIPRAQRNVAHHYDLSDRLYELFLDRDRQYSCAYFLSGDDSLEKAQEQKKRHIAAKLLLEPGQEVLDIGCGWGGLALSLAKFANVKVTGITLSRGQHRYATERAEREGLGDRVRFLLQDYREVGGRFDRIVSVGMFEHVGVAHYQTYMRRVAEMLNDDGVALVHTIGRAEPPSTSNPWISKYIFPGGYIPAMSEVLPPIERNRLYVTDVEVLRLHYAETLRAWRRRFRAARTQVLEFYDERFYRMWELYLVLSEVAFRYTGLVAFQFQMAKDQTAVPLTRDYITEFERSGASAQWQAA